MCVYEDALRGKFEVVSWIYESRQFDRVKRFFFVFVCVCVCACVCLCIVMILIKEQNIIIIALQRK